MIQGLILVFREYVSKHYDYVYLIYVKFRNFWSSPFFLKVFCCDDVVYYVSWVTFSCILLLIPDSRAATYFNFSQKVLRPISSFLCYLNVYETLECFPSKLIEEFQKLFAYPLPTLHNRNNLHISHFVGVYENFSHFYWTLLLRYICYNVLHVCPCTLLYNNRIAVLVTTVFVRYLTPTRTTLLTHALTSCTIVCCAL